MTYFIIVDLWSVRVDIMSWANEGRYQARHAHLVYSMLSLELIKLCGRRVRWQDRTGAEGTDLEDRLFVGKLELLLLLHQLQTGQVLFVLVCLRAITNKRVS